MFGKRLKIFKLLGFEVKVDASWIIIALLVAWSLSTGFFPVEYRGLSSGMYWVMGVAGTLGLFVSIIIHEFSHSLVARRFGMSMKGITLFIFGGVAEMAEEPPSAKAEFMMAIVGPLSSMGIALVLYGVHSAGVGLWSVPIGGVIRYLAIINVLLAVFNLVPAFPLDGGRVLRSILWGIKGSLSWATRISAQFGAFFGILLIALGFWRIFYGNLIGGMWVILIGIFLQGAARASYQQMLARTALEGLPVQRFMNAQPVAVPSSIGLSQFVEDYLYRYDYKLFPVVDDGKLTGCLTVSQVKAVPRSQWPYQRVGDLVTQCSLGNTIDPKADAVDALSRMNRHGVSRLLVVEADRLIGIIALKDLLRFLAMKMELEEGGESVNR